MGSEKCGVEGWWLRSVKKTTRGGEKGGFLGWEKGFGVGLVGLFLEWSVVDCAWSVAGEHVGRVSHFVTFVTWKRVDIPAVRAEGARDANGG
jgi:hypothetical protein